MYHEFVEDHPLGVKVSDGPSCYEGYGPFYSGGLKPVEKKVCETISDVRNPTDGKNTLFFFFLNFFSDVRVDQPQKRGCVGDSKGDGVPFWNGQELFPIQVPGCPRWSRIQLPGAPGLVPLR